MKPMYSSAELQTDIIALEAKRLRQEAEMRRTAEAALDSLKPANLVKNTFNSVVKTPGIGKSVLKGVVGLAAGFLSKKLFFRGPGLAKKAVGALVEVGVAKAVAENAEKIGEGGKKLLQKVMKR